MSLIPRNSLFGRNSFFDDFFPQTQWENEFSKTFTPRVEIKDKESAYEISAVLPGVKKEDLHVTLENGILTIEAETRQDDKEEKEGKIIHQERYYGKYMRSFSVGEHVKQEDIKASFNDGILTLEAPKTAAQIEPEKKRIEIM